jgi:aromatic ring-opening dioxygenase LigB subunit
MIVYGAIMPHTPLLIPSIGKDVYSQIKKTREACEKIAKEIYSRHIDTIFLIADQVTVHEDALSINIKDPFSFDLSEFGDFGFDVAVRPDLQLIDRLQRYLRKENERVSLNTDKNLIFSTAVPLHFLIKQFPTTKLVAVSPPTYMKKSEIFDCGIKIQNILQESNKRIAVICAGDLSHRANNAKNQNADIFDNNIFEAIQNTNAAILHKLDDSIINSSSQTIFEEILLLFGVFDKISFEVSHLNYEAPFGVGYITAAFEPL